MAQIVNNLDRPRVFTISKDKSFRLNPRETKSFTGEVTQEMLDNATKGYIFIKEDSPKLTKTKKKERE